MSRDVITVGSTMRIPLLYRGEYSQWRQRFMNYLKEQTDGEAMINSIQNGDQPLPVIAQVLIRGSEYGEQDIKAAILYEYETIKAIEGEQLLDTYLRYLQVINDLKKYGYKKDNYVNDALGYKKKAVVVHSDPLGLVAKKINISKLKEKVVVSSDSEGSGSANKKQEFVKINDKKVEKKADEKKRDMSKVKCYNCKKEGHFTKDCKKAKVKDYNYYKTKMLLAKKDSDEQVLFAEDQAWMESSNVSNREINANMVFMAQIEKVLSESNESSSSAKEAIAEVAYYTSESESESEFETSEYYDNSTNYGLFVNSDDDQEIFHDAIESASENFFENHIDSQKRLLIKTSSLKPYVPNVILEKIIIDLEDEVVSLLEKEKENLKTIKSLKSNGFELSENTIFKSENQSENDCHVVEKECDKVENPKVIAPGMFKISVLQCVSPISESKTSCDSNNVESKLKTKRRKRKSSKQNEKQVNNDVSRANSDFVHFSDLDTFSSVRRPKNTGVIWKKKGSSNTSNVDLSDGSLSKLNKNVKRYSRKDLLSSNNSHLRETSSASVCNDAMNVSCNSR
nr:hypothetical protein [Tanacetum cinerariifolium]